MTKLHTRLAAWGLLLTAPALVAAQTPPPGVGEPGQVEPGATAEAPKPENTLNVHGLVGTDFTTHYISRGLVLEDQGFITQPYAELGFTVYDEPTESLTKATLYGGIWNSIHCNDTDAGLASGGDPVTPSWYEFDAYVGLSLDFLETWNLNTSYWEFMSPNDGFLTSHNLQFKLSYNDAGRWGESDFALKPYGIVFFELNGKAGSGSDEGVYVELGVEPTIYTFNGDSSYPLSISVPLKVGLGFADFYEDDDVYGFTTIGLKLGFPLAFIPESAGAWSGYAGVYYYNYGDGVDDFNEGTGDGDDDIVAAGGVSFTF
jgi:hypothetical protein